MRRAFAATEAGQVGNVRPELGGQPPGGRHEVPAGDGEAMDVDEGRSVRRRRRLGIRPVQQAPTVEVEVCLAQADGITAHGGNVADRRQGAMVYGIRPCGPLLPFRSVQPCGCRTGSAPSPLSRPWPSRASCPCLSSRSHRSSRPWRTWEPWSTSPSWNMTCQPSGDAIDRAAQDFDFTWFEASHRPGSGNLTALDTQVTVF